MLPLELIDPIQYTISAFTNNPSKPPSHPTSITLQTQLRTPNRSLLHHIFRDASHSLPRATASLTSPSFTCGTLKITVPATKHCSCCEAHQEAFNSPRCSSDVSCTAAGWVVSDLPYPPNSSRSQPFPSPCSEAALAARCWRRAAARSWSCSPLKSFHSQGSRAHLPGHLPAQAARQASRSPSTLATIQQQTSGS